jgi:hypothetical protein
VLRPMAYGFSPLHTLSSQPRVLVSTQRSTMRATSLRCCFWDETTVLGPVLPAAAPRRAALVVCAGPAAP